MFYDSRVLTVVESGDFWLSETPEIPGSSSWNTDLPRMATWALFERRSDKRRFYLFNTHFAHRDQDEAAREHSARVILSRIATLPANIPVVVTGDFNSDPDNGTYRTLTAALGDARSLTTKRQGPEKPSRTSPLTRPGASTGSCSAASHRRAFPHWISAPAACCRQTTIRCWPNLPGRSDIATALPCRPERASLRAIARDH